MINVQTNCCKCHAIMQFFKIWAGETLNQLLHCGCGVICQIFFCFNCPLSSGEKQFKMKLLLFTTTFILACCSVVRCKPPNIVMFLTDDLDNQLGGLTPLTKTKEWIGDKGANFNNAFVVVPVCCPSRYTSNQIPADR